MYVKCIDVFLLGAFMRLLIHAKRFREIFGKSYAPVRIDAGWTYFGILSLSNLFNIQKQCLILK